MSAQLQPTKRNLKLLVEVLQISGLGFRVAPTWSYRGSLSLRMGDFCNFVGTNFFDCEKLAYQSGYQYLLFSECGVYFKYNIFGVFSQLHGNQSLYHNYVSPHVTYNFDVTCTVAQPWLPRIPRVHNILKSGYTMMILPSFLPWARPNIFHCLLPILRRFLPETASCFLRLQSAGPGESRHCRMATHHPAVTPCSFHTPVKRRVLLLSTLCGQTSPKHSAHWAQYQECSRPQRRCWWGLQGLGWKRVM